MNRAILIWVKRHRWLVFLIKRVQKMIGLLLRPWLVAGYFKRHPLRKLQLGAHLNLLPGWLNSDLYPQSLQSITLNAAKRFPFADGTFDYILSEHQLEHISYTDGRVMLEECCRVLKPGGKIRLALPSLDRLLELDQTPAPTPLQKRYLAGVMQSCFPGCGEPNPCFAFNAAFLHWGHRFLYDLSTLKEALERAGFSGVVQCAPGVSNEPHLHGLEFRTSEADCYETMVVEAVRPVVSPSPLRSCDLAKTS